MSMMTLENRVMSDGRVARSFRVMGPVAFAPGPMLAPSTFVWNRQGR